MNLSNENYQTYIINHEETRDSSDIEETLFIFIQTFVLLYTLLLLFLHPVFMTYVHQKLGGNKNREKNQLLRKELDVFLSFFFQPHFLPVQCAGQMMESSKPTNNILC